jgi:3-methylcrotonyl-CoA carboxylase beta subunit
MSLVPLVPIGDPRERVADERTFKEQREALAPLEERLQARRAEVHAGWGEKYAARVHQKGKLTARERLAQLMDPGSEAFEVGTFVNYGITFGEGLTSPGAGVVTAFARVEGRYCMVIANDNTVASGSWWPKTPEKIERAQMMALRLRIPVIYLVDCSGLFLPEQSRAFPGGTGAGHIFKMNSLLSANGVPQLAGVFGDCIAGGGYMPIISDRVYMTEQAYMVIAGAALIKGAKSTKITSLDIGGPEVHVHQSGCADVRVPNDDVLIACLREEMRKLPSSGADFYRGGIGAMDPAYPSEELAGLLPVDHREAYDANQVLARLCDQSLFWEVMPEVGDEMICGIGRIGGLYAGFVINRQGLVNDADKPGSQRTGATLYRGGIAKISAFSRACDSDGIPLIWLQDISGFDIGGGRRALGPSRLRLKPHLHQQHKHHAYVHRASAKSIGGRILRDGRPSLRSRRPAQHLHLALERNGRTHSCDCDLQHQARRQTSRSPRRTRPSASKSPTACAPSKNASKATWIPSSPQSKWTLTRSSPSASCVRI